MQFAQANAHTKNCKRACFANADKIDFKKFANASNKIKIHRHTARQTQQTMTQKLNTNKVYSDTVDRRPAGNSGFAKKRVQWLIEHSTSHQLLLYVDSFVLRNPLLRKAAKRCILLRQDSSVTRAQARLIAAQNPPRHQSN